PGCKHPVAALALRIILNSWRRASGKQKMLRLGHAGMRAPRRGTRLTHYSQQQVKSWNGEKRENVPLSEWEMQISDKIFEQSNAFCRVVTAENAKNACWRNFSSRLLRKFVRFCDFECI
ncbi:MAG: hypothetical protein MJY87_11725, partial [Fibrobacter sp.]|nr:hypothetical protein [Fibrobacter sp.]